MASPSSAAGQGREAFVYRLAPPGVLAEHLAPLESILRAELEAPDPERHRIAISAGSGWISYADERQLWERPEPSELPPPGEAQRRAEDLVVRLARALSPADRRYPEVLHGVGVAPPMTPRAAGLARVPRPDGSGWDHWLYRAQPRLRLERDDRGTDVLGAHIEIRIGDGARVVGMSWRWRPLLPGTLRTRLRPRQGAAGHAGEGGHSHAGVPGGPGGAPPAPAQVVYQLAGDGVPQLHLAPYYLVADGDHLALESASPHSLTAELEVRRTRSGVEVTARAAGGSGEYRYHWAAVALDRLGEEGGEGEAVGEGRVERDQAGVLASTISLPAGAFLVLIDVVDPRTGAHRHVQQQVFAMPAFEALEVPPAPPGVA